MRQAKRNTRQAGKGSAPVPLPILLIGRTFTITQSGTKAVITYEPYDVRADANPILNNDLIVTGRQSTAKVVNTADDSVWYPESIAFVANKVQMTYPDGSNTEGELELYAPAFDPAIRSTYGAWMAPLYAGV
mgnify:CR=1 FL=1